VAVGYVKVTHDRIDKDPDRRIQEALALVFRKFAEMQTVRQVHLWFRQERLSLPAVGYGLDGRYVEWKPPARGILSATRLFLMLSMVVAAVVMTGLPRERGVRRSPDRRPASDGRRVRRCGR
jgi:hypothetical protein